MENTDKYTDTTRVYVKGAVLQNAIRNNNITQSDLCKMMNIREDKLSLIIHGKKTIVMSELEEICSLLGINPKTAINETKKKPSDYKATSIPEAKWNSDYFQECLDNKEIHLADLCRVIKRSASTICDYKAGRANPSVETLEKICNTLDCSPMLLIGVSGEYLNKMLGRQAFKEDSDYVKEPTYEDVKDTCGEVPIVTLHPGSNTEDNITENDIENKDNVFKEDKYKSFESMNVIDNIETINKNLLAMVEDLGMANSVLLKKMDELMSMNVHLAERIDSLEKRTSIKSVSQPVQFFKSNNSTLWGNNTCSEAEMKEIIKSEVKNCTVKDYKDKIYKLAAYMAKKENNISNAVLSKSYSQFTRIYGITIDSLKQETGMNGTIDAIYANPLSREIYFNMMCTNASHA